MPIVVLGDVAEPELARSTAVIGSSYSTIRAQESEQASSGHLSLRQGTVPPSRAAPHADEVDAPYRPQAMAKSLISVSFPTVISLRYLHQRRELATIDSMCNRWLLLIGLLACFNASTLEAGLFRETICSPRYTGSYHATSPVKTPAAATSPGYGGAAWCSNVASAIRERMSRTRICGLGTRPSGMADDGRRSELSPNRGACHAGRQTAIAWTSDRDRLEILRRTWAMIVACTAIATPKASRWS